jgi:hypothetical protein
MASIAAKTFRDTFIFLETFEKGLNIVGYFPYIGTVSAYLRANYSALEIIAGVAIAIFATGMHIQQNPNAAIYLALGGTLLFHGILNRIRAVFESIPFLPLITTLPYDLVATLYLRRRYFSYIQ